MFRVLIANTLISAFAYSIVSVVGLLLIPLLIRVYGISQYGMLVLARLFFPSSMFGVFDFGFAETATQAVARARIDHDWRRTGGQVLLLLLLAGGVGLVLGAAIAFNADVITRLLKIDAPYRTSFVLVLQLTAVALLVVFPGLVCEGILKGYEAFRQLRTCEVTSTVAYAVVAASVAWQEQPYATVAYAFIGSLVLRAALVTLFTFRICRNELSITTRWSAEDRRDVLLRCRVMVVNKILGTVQSQGSPILLGLLLNSAAVGAYDVLVRLPRFAKSILGLLNTAVLPLAARLETSADTTQLTRLNRVGLAGVATLSLPPLAAGAVFSEPILRWWIGSNFTQYWVWQAAMFLVPALTALVSYGMTSLLLRPSVVVVLNRIALFQVIVQIAIGMVFLSQWQERAFILGQVSAVCLAFFMQICVICRQHSLKFRDTQGLVVGGGLICMGVAGSLAGDLPGLVEGPLSLIVAIGMWSVCAWSALFLVMYSAEQRRTFTAAVVALGRKKLIR